MDEQNEEKNQEAVEFRQSNGIIVRKAMRKTILSVLMALATIIANAQTEDQAVLYILRNGGSFEAFYNSEIDSIVFAIDKKGDKETVVEEIHTTKGVSRIPLETISRMVFIPIEKVLSTCPDDNHPHAIDLGLPSGTKWACCNVGAKEPEGYGGYYAWGETEEKAVYNDVSYLYSSGLDSGDDGWYDDYHDNGLYGEWEDIGSDIAGTSYDVAHVRWGGSWCMPSLDQMKELLDNCSSSWARLNGVYGRLFKGKNGGTMFLPAAGYRWDDGYFNDGNYGYHGYYWSSKQTYGFDHYYAYHLFIYCGDAYWNGQYAYNRVYGSSVRPVCK
ncbi:MAG: hypothetical protein IKH26_06925 [Bacteroidaceae bacterium]|nr:hypothetical protein [Bacteroidaceae bacterium]